MAIGCVRLFRLSMLHLTLVAVCAPLGLAQGLRSFSIRDEIGMAYFGSPFSGGVDPLVVSPDKSLVAAICERGLPDENRVQDEIRIYRIEDLRRSANDPSHTGYPPPLWTLVKTSKQGPVITSLRWLPDSGRIAFLLRTEDGRKQLWLGDVAKQTLSSLTPVEHDVTDFDVTDTTHFAYAVRSPPSPEKMMLNDAAIVGTGISLYSRLLLPLDPNTTNRRELWAAHGGKPSLIRDPSSGAPLITYAEHGGYSVPLAQSPDGETLSTYVILPEVPKEWETMYSPAPGRETYRIRTGHQDLNVMTTISHVAVYATIDLRTGKISKVTDAPDAYIVAWAIGARQPSWSEDHKILLPGTFIAGSSTPCIAVATPDNGSIECVQKLKYEFTEEYVTDVRFAAGRSDRVTLKYIGSKGVRKMRTLGRTSEGKWEVLEDVASSDSHTGDTEVTIKQSLSDPPVLVVTDLSTHKSLDVWDPNPQLKEIKLGDAAVYRWKDDTGRDWIAGLYKPVDYQAGHHYPLVIQTHGFDEKQFFTNGVYPTAFAARALAAQGFVVLQVNDCSVRLTPDEAPCQVRGYESVVKQLDKDGIIDINRMGIVGFSRTCYYVMHALTTSTLHFRAASTTQGINAGYLQYLTTAEIVNNLYQKDAESVIGAPAYGAGLQQWLKASPEFNLDKITTPLLIVPNVGMNTLSMWEPYAILRMMKKPVELIALNSNEHVLTNPAARLVSQGGTVDWFRFWLQDYEDPDPAKAAQYQRWRSLRALETGHGEDASNHTRP